MGQYLERGGPMKCVVMKKQRDSDPVVVGRGKTAEKAAEILMALVWASGGKIEDYEIQEEE